MKKEKLYLIVILCGGIALFLFLFSLLLIVGNYQKLKKDYQTLLQENPIRTFVCNMKDDSLEAYDYEQKVTFQVDEDSEVINSTTEYILTYREKNFYDLAKNDIDYGEYQVEFDDEHLQIIQTEKKDKIENSEEKKLHIWFKDYINSLENIQYQCIEK